MLLRQKDSRRRAALIDVAECVPTDRFRMSERPFLGRMIVYGSHDLEIEPSGLTHLVGGLTLPATSGTATCTGESWVAWYGPRQWLVLTPPSLAASISAQVARDAARWGGAAVDISDGQTTIEIIGSASDAILAGGTTAPIADMPVNHVLRTRLGKVDVLIHRREACALDLHVARTYAEYLWLWLMDAKEEFTAAATPSSAGPTSFSEPRRGVV